MGCDALLLVRFVAAANSSNDDADAVAAANSSNYDADARLKNIINLLSKRIRAYATQI